MRLITKLCGTVCAVGLLACGTQQSVMGKRFQACGAANSDIDDGCNGLVCNVTVTVPVDGGPPALSKGLVEVPKDTRKDKNNPQDKNQPVMIVWRLHKDAQDKYEFKRTDGPVNIKNNTNANNGIADFSDGSPTANGKHYRIRFDNSLAGQEYKYDLQVTRKSDQTPFSCDPFINNQGI